MPPRSWGWWTEQKLDILGDYLVAFTKASTTAHASVYLDLFAGQARERQPQPQRAADPRIRPASAGNPAAILGAAVLRTGR